MNLNRLVNLIFVSILLFSFFIVQTANAEDNSENLVKGFFDIELKSATDLKISVTMDVGRAFAFGTFYDKNDIKNLASSTNPDDIEARGVIKGGLHDALKNQIETTFKDANIVSLNEKPVYEDDVFKEEYNVNLTSDFFDINETITPHYFINGILDMGAYVNYSFNLQATAGWNNTFSFKLGDSFSYSYVNTGFISGDNIAEWKVYNWNGNSPSEYAILKLKKNDPTTHDLTDENISLNFIINSADVDDTSLMANVLIETADIEVYDVLPGFVSNLKVIPADGFRLFVNNGLFTWDDVYIKTVKPIEEKIKNKIETSSFNQTLDLSTVWDNKTTECLIPYEIHNMNKDPFLRAKIKDEDIKLKICDISNRGLFGLINAGAEVNISEGDINFGDNLQGIEYDYNITLYLPKNIYLDEKNIYEWDDASSASGEFKSDISHSYPNEEKETIIEIEIKNTDLNLLSFLTGETELNLGIYLQEKRDYKIMEIPEVFTLPEKVSLTYLNSDAFRVCSEEKVFSGEDMDRFLEAEKNIFENRLDRLLPGIGVKGNGHVKKDVFDDSLDNWDKDISEMDAKTPIIIENYAHRSYAVSFDLSFLPPRFEIPTQKFNFSGIQNHNVTYKIFFPEGMSLEVSDPLNKATVHTTRNGRKYIEIHFDESEHDLTDVVSCKITPSILFTIGIFMPCLVSLIITIILVVTIFVLRRKRKIKKTKPAEDEELTGYEEEDYYVPPPPESK